MSGVCLGLMKNGESCLPKFSECIVDYFNKESNSVKVSCNLQNNVLIIRADQNGHELKHSPECPFRTISKSDDKNSENMINPDKRNCDIRVAVSMIIESADNHVLLTRRPSHMRVSPGVWVTPGGHLEFGETLLQGGVREVMEETGLDVTSGESGILCLWENVYPLMLGFGPPSTHVLVVYYHTRMKESWEVLQQKITMDPDEVESCCWLNAEMLSEMFLSNQTKQPVNQYVSENGQVVRKHLDSSKMFNKYLFSQSQPHSGVQLVLRAWHKKVTKLETVKKSKI